MSKELVEHTEVKLFGKERPPLFKVVWVINLAIINGVMLSFIGDRQSKTFQWILIGVLNGALIGLASTKIIKHWAIGALVGFLMSIVFIFVYGLATSTGFIVEERQISLARLLLGALWQFTFFGAIVVFFSSGFPNRKSGNESSTAWLEELEK